MIVEFKKSKPFGTVSAPPSKSYAHRALICSAFSDESVISGIVLSEDIKATLNCLDKLGAVCKIKNGEIKIKGIDRNNIPDNITLDCAESGSTLRFLIPVCLSFGKPVGFTGSRRLFDRPLFEYERFSEKYGFKFDKKDNFLTVCGNLCSGVYDISAETSSQFVSGLVFALSFSQGKSEIRLTGDVLSKPYIDMTVDTLKSFGTDIEYLGKVIRINGKKYAESTRYIIEGDCSNAAYLEAFSFLNEGVGVCGVNLQTLQGDFVYKKMFADLKNGVKNFDLRNCPDLAPIMFSASCLFGGGHFCGTKRLKFKESDRAVCMGEELEKFGVVTTVFDDEVIIDSGKIHPPAVPLNSHNDHRIVMALSLLCVKYGGKIQGADAVSKSFPDYFEKLEQLGVDFNRYDS